MTITLRLDKGSELTFQELDNNFTDLNSRLNVLETTDTDNQTLTLNGTTLSISNGNSVDLGSVSASVSIGDSAPITPEAGDLWWQSDVGRLRIYYTDTDGSQWVDASPTGAGGGGSNVTVSDGAPSTPVTGDLWWESDIGKLRIYYNNVWVDAAPSGTGGSTSGDLSIASISALGDVDFNSITLDGSNGQNKVLAWDEALQSFVPRSTAVVTVSDVPPATPVEGDLWWESDVGKLRIYYNDGVQSQWVDANPAGTGVDLDDLNVVTSRGSTTTNTITVGGVVTDSVTSTGTISSDTSLRTQGNIEFEGSTNNAFETRLQVVDPTQDNTITFQNASGTVAFLSDIVGGGGGIALTDISVTSLAAAGGGTLTYDNITGVFDYTPPDLSSFSTFDGDYNSLTNKPTIPSALTDLGIVDGTNGQVLTTDGAGSFTFTTVTGGSGIALTDLSVGAEDPASGDGGISYDNTTGVFTYAPPDLSLYQPVGNLNADIDGHLNTSTATANQILSWDGADYAWVADQTGAGSSYTDADVATYLNGNLDSHIIPDTNATYDIGSAEYKIRHLFLSDNSLKFTDTTDPLNIVEYAFGVTNDYRLQFNGNSIKNTSAVDALNAGAIDVTITNHFITNGETYTLADGTYIGQELKFWRVAGAGYADITVANAIYTNGANTTAQAAAFVWRLGDASIGMYNCIWNGTAWVLSSGQPAV